MTGTTAPGDFLPDRIEIPFDPSRGLRRRLSYAAIFATLGGVAMWRLQPELSYCLIVCAASLVVTTLVRHFSARTTGDSLVLDRAGFSMLPRLLFEPVPWSRCSQFRSSWSLTSGRLITWYWAGDDDVSRETDTHRRRAKLFNNHVESTQRIVDLLNAFRTQAADIPVRAEKSEALPDRVSVHGGPAGGFEQTIFITGAALLANSLSNLFWPAPPDWQFAGAVVTSAVAGVFLSGVGESLQRLVLERDGFTERTFLKTRKLRWDQCTSFRATDHRDGGVGFGIVRGRNASTGGLEVSKADLEWLAPELLLAVHGDSDERVAHVMNRFRNRALGLKDPS